VNRLEHSRGDFPPFLCFASSAATILSAPPNELPRRRVRVGQAGPSCFCFLSDAAAGLSSLAQPPLYLYFPSLLELDKHETLRAYNVMRDLMEMEIVEMWQCQRSG
jgi:hypothetical protein